MFCSNCGTKNDDNALFCYECGNSLKNAAANAAQDNVYRQQAPQEAVYHQPAASASRNPFLTYELPNDPIIKLPFPSFVLKFIKMGVWTLYFFAIFFGWFFVGSRGWYNDTASLNLFQVIFGSKEIADGMGILVFAGVLVLLVLLGVIAIQVLNMFLTKKILTIPQIVLCAAPALITFLFMILAWIVMGVAASEVNGYGIVEISGGPGFGAWLVFLLSGMETAAFILFMKGKNESLFKV